MAEVRIDRLGKSYGAVEVLKDVSLTVDNGSFVVLVGPSGCGKTTLLRMIAGLEPVTSGTKTIGGRSIANLPPAQRGIAMVFQSYALYPHMDVYGNMAFGLRFAGVGKAEIDRRVTEAARILQLEDLFKRKPRELSGGQRQRVAIGRAIVREPQVFLFDEPLSNLDAGLRVNTRLEIARLRRLLRATIIYVTHDQVEAMTLADRIVVLNHGRIEQVGSPLELYRRPANLFVAGFIGSPKMNFVQGSEAETLDAHTIGIRPEHIETNLEIGHWQGEIVHIEHLGTDTYLYVDVPKIGTMTVRLDGEADYPLGSSVFLTPRRTHLHRFDADGQRIAA
jgi:multiple sugar transport system ATP-binding protein